jgi:hypothetical protein
MSPLLARIAPYRKPIVLTFEIFWIVVFALEAATGAAGPAAVQFVYENF